LGLAASVEVKIVPRLPTATQSLVEAQEIPVRSCNVTFRHLGLPPPGLLETNRALRV
jgi:hypothetical protein